MKKNKAYRFIAMLLAVCLISIAPAQPAIAAGLIGSSDYPPDVLTADMELPDTNAHDEVDGYARDYNAQLLTARKSLLLYFGKYENGVVSVETYLSEGVTKNYNKDDMDIPSLNAGTPFVPDMDRQLIIDTANYITQNTRVELCDSEGRYLGIIAFDESYGQSYSAVDQVAEINVSNLVLWDGTYWDSDLKRKIYPGEDADGNLPTGKHEFIIAFQPTDTNKIWRGLMKITIDYSEDARLANMQYVPDNNAFIRQSVDSCPGDPVYIVTGNFLWDYTDFSIFGSEPLEFSRNYNAQDGVSGELGFGWRHNYSARLEIQNSFVDVVTNDGYRYSFALKGDGQYSASDGVTHTLEKTASGFAFTTQNKTEYCFNSSGYLTSIVDVNGNATIITRNGSHIAAISNDSGTLTFSYSGDNIASITDQTGRSVYYTYDSNGDLVSFQNADNDTIDYTYGDAANPHMITAITDFNGNTYVENTYDSLGRVVAQYMAGQGHIDLCL